LIPKGERSGLQTHIAMTESVMLCVRMNIDCFCGTRIGDLRLGRFFYRQAGVDFCRLGVAKRI
jgi:hypothetical protein